MIKLQNIILEMVARGRPLEETLRRLCLLVEERYPEVLCSILSVDKGGRLHPLAGPRLPNSYSDALDGVAIGPDVGSCGSAAFLRKEIVVTDIATDKRWTDFKHLALPIGLRACWSYPIELASGQVAGTFAFYFNQTRGPTPDEREIIEICLHLCAIALERDERVRERERRIHNDELTGLQNRASFDAAMHELASGPSQTWGLLTFDLDNLKSTNDTFGHGAGDDLLKVVASRLTEVAFPSPVFRLGGDEFAVIVKGSSTDLASIAELALGELRRPARCGRHMVAPSATAGGAMCDRKGEVPEVVRQNADLALYHAKDQTRGAYVEYQPRLRSRMARRAGVIRRVSQALAENRIEAHYQPICRLKDKQVIGFEALCRLRTQNGAVIAASHFLEATTDALVSAALTQLMLSCVARDLRDWSVENRCPPYVAINLSPADFQNNDLTTLLCEALQQAGITSRRIVIEITEEVYLGADARIVIRQIERLKQAGFRLALDDFGTGYASLSHLLDIPVDIIKVDRTFVKKIGENKQAAAIIRGLITTAKELDLEVVAEGVETEAQLNNLIALGCASGQGYLFGRAAPPGDIAPLLGIRQLKQRVIDAA